MRAELTAQDALLPTEAVVAFDGPAAALAADLYRRLPGAVTPVRRPREKGALAGVSH